MKSKILIIIALCFAKMLFAQDSIRIETVTDTAFKTPQYISVYDDVFLSHKETKWLFKADLMGLLGMIEGKNYYGAYTFSKPISLEFEHKLSKPVSINTGLSIHSQLFYSQLTVLFEPRWYFNKNKLTTKNQSADNLNGSYLSLRGNATHRFLANDIFSFKSNVWSLRLNYGIQKRVFNNFYINYRAGLGYGSRDNLMTASGYIENNQDNLFIDSDFTLGVAFGSGKKKAVNTCDLFRCFETEKRLWKFDITNLLPSLDKFFQSSSLRTAYEFKLGNNKAWSINAGLDMYLSRTNFGPWASSYTSIAYFSLAPRYYYNINKNIAKGKSANNLSGCYLTLEMGLGATGPTKPITIAGQSVAPFFAKEDYYQANSWKIIPKWGVQKRLFRKGFVDFSFAPYWYQKTLKVIPTNVWISSYKEHNFLKPDFKIGFAF